MKYALWAIVEIIILKWFICSVRQRVPHEIAMSLGALLGAALWFETFTHLLPQGNTAFGTPGWLQTAGSVLLFVGAALALISILTLRLRGKPSSGWEHTSQLIETGIYRWVRHPLYLAALLVIAGMVLLRTAPITLALWISSSACLVLAARFEDRYNAEKFSEPYRAYQVKSKLLIPFLY
jgi:protein-S-isoprenylcysteine O-methyltransferase Ste14